MIIDIIKLKTYYVIKLKGYWICWTGTKSKFVVLHSVYIYDEKNNGKVKIKISYLFYKLNTRHHRRALRARYL